MAKSYKMKHEKKEDLVVETEGLSKKELYDLEKEKRLNKKELEQKKKNKKKKVNNKKTQTNLGARIFAIFMLILMIGSVVVWIVDV